MIVFQFSLSVIFIACAALLKYQAGHLFEADFGYNREKVAFVQLGKESLGKVDVLKDEIARHQDVVHVSAAENLPLVWDSPTPVRLPEAAEDESFTMEAYGVDYGFVETLEIRMKEGRSFSKDFADNDSLILSETAVRKLGWENPIGRQLIVDDKIGTVIGVAEDFLFADIGFEIPPAVLYFEPENLSVLLVKFSSPEGFPELRQYIKEQWTGLMPDQPFECRTLSEHFGLIFGLLGKLTGFLNMIGITAVLFSCLGLLGLATYLTQRRTKEIGIRKVLGASSLNIMWRMTREFLLLVTAANAIALGIVYFGWNKALQTGLLFITPINAGTYILAVSVSLLTAFLAVASQTLKASWANPANSLRHE
jgi:putative ABC transport system permease protein